MEPGSATLKEVTSR